MTFTARTYDEIVRDMLTTLTGGTVRESFIVPADTLLMPKLKNHPVRRVAFAESIGVDDVHTRFTAADFELVSTSGNDNDRDAIRFRERGRKPAAGSTLIVNYYPVRVDNPVPLTDVTVGSVIRTMLETVGVELALTYQQLETVYKSAFLDTAESDALDKVVSLVGVQRAATGRAVAKLRFTRRPGTAGTVTIPANTPVTDGKGKRFRTTVEATMEPGESTREVLAMAETTSTSEAAANTLQFLEIAIGGISEVTNPDIARRLTEPETDDGLRTRARNALRATVHGTPDAVRYGLLAIEGVKDVVVKDFPNGVAGEIEVSVAYTEPNDAVKKLVAARLDEIRPAGIRILTADAQTLKVAVKVALTLAGASLSGADLQSVKSGVGERLSKVLKGVPTGGVVRQAQLSVAVLSDARIVDADITLTPDGQSDTKQLELPANTALELLTPFAVTTAFEKEGAGAVTSTVTMSLPLQLVGATTKEQAQSRIEANAATLLASRNATAPLTFDALATALRSDTEYALVRADGLVTVESGGGKFLQVTDAGGSYAPATNETLIKGTISIDVRGTI